MGEAVRYAIRLAVGEFALPVPRKGSIELYSGYARGAEVGIEIHTRIQKRTSKNDPNFRSEIPIQGLFERDEFHFHVCGRLDCLFEGDSPRIEEIKTGFNLFDLERRLSDPSHPYRLQLLTYGYLYFRTHQIVPRLFFHLVSTRNAKSQNLDVTLDIEEYERWLDLRLGELVEEARLSQARARRRKRIAEELPFPFAVPRPGQTALISEVEAGIAAKSPLLIQAPTGLGKTVGVLFPVLREALSRGGRVVYVTPKNSQHSVAENAVAQFQEKGARVRSLTVTAKSKLCLKAEPLCNPEYCEYARDYYEKVAKAGLARLLASKRKLTERTFRTIGEQYQVCPFELQVEGAKDADVIICDYNYVFAPRSAFTKLSDTATGEEGPPNLVIDEVHNLPSRALNYFSSELSTLVLERMRSAFDRLPSEFRTDLEALLDGAIATVRGCAPEATPKADKAAEIDPPATDFREQDALFRSFLTRYLESDIEIEPRDPVLRITFYWSQFTEALDHVALDSEVNSPRRFITTFRAEPNGHAVAKIACFDAAQMLENSYQAFANVIGFSATSKPFDYYATLSGLPTAQLRTAEFHSPFPKANRKILIIPEISTKYSDRTRNYTKVAETIRRISEIQPGNYVAFFPSFEFLVQVGERLIPPMGFSVVKQRRDMKAVEIESILTQLQLPDRPTILLAVQGGVFSEGVDYPGKTLIGAFVVGPPLPLFDLERERMRDYFEKRYGHGFDYAYGFPAMAKAVQAAGRVIRSETDRGIIVLMDNRFLAESYCKTFPADWFDKSPRELVSTSILKDVRDFWSQGN